MRMNHEEPMIYKADSHSPRFSTGYKETFNGFDKKDPESSSRFKSSKLILRDGRIAPEIRIFGYDFLNLLKINSTWGVHELSMKFAYPIAVIGLHLNILLNFGYIEGDYKEIDGDQYFEGKLSKKIFSFLDPRHPWSSR